MQGFGNRSWFAGVTLAFVLVIAGCSTPRGPAPVEDRGTMTRAPAATVPGGPPITTDANGKPLAGIENYGKPGYYAVRPGDTIRRIGIETGQRWQDLVRWNNLDNPDLIEVGQVLRVIPPAGSGTVVATAPVTSPPGAASPDGVVTKPVTPQPVVVPTTPSSGATKPTAPVTASPASPGSGGSGDEDLGWIWPASGSLIAGFDEAKNKGYDISGKAGDPVLAAADGRVVYAGAGLRGYGNLIILKHNNTYLTAYAHNQTLLVKEDQSVQKGQKIAEMGNSDADRVKLHFEIRRQGKPVDPSRYLPNR
ncbi:peptidoglycan DD-metalloendopeptidase family protein [Variovorax sp. NFACC27]|uniref:LysM peptidoglycan-binding domain-containing protein n=1 Tax=Variovorax gossypii TaxID=1679495 RepID=A0A431TGI3_9BURK|nr:MULTISPECIES: peptidoglycan DD-metalloendopeptidase family protein [Variovorax]SEF28560.1 lipoprotein NlpD [Variovorax sp. NFACC28]SEG78457.1 lipoprotein NlpD [Variovorax sp. NFACC29]SFC95105.1 lipoprotein NlpD [Variovorax sp. NFACC26]SFG08410.1 lipoprotein NlpD [Variovorax sp. NFACC27]RTQ31750.1 LysM peptidoglycan-binding domain-containing protein [Variovorax gossypii]